MMLTLTLDEAAATALATVIRQVSPPNTGLTRPRGIVRSTRSRRS
jgi:hypothetical protein